MGKGQKIGYIRVSTEGQNTARQERALDELDLDKIFIDKASGKNTSRPRLKKMLEYVRAGDVIYVESISRFSRSVPDLISLMTELDAKEVNFISLKEGAIDTTTPHGKLIYSIFGVLAEYERDIIRERQSEGIAVAKSKGIYKGRAKRKYNMEDLNSVLTSYICGNITTAYAMKRLSVSRTTLWRLEKLYRAGKLEEYLNSDKTYETVMSETPVAEEE